MYEDVVDAVVDEIGADRVVTTGEERDTKLGTDAVGARDEHRLLVSLAIETEQPAERPNVREDAGRERRFRQRPDSTNGFIARVDVDARLTIIH